MSTKPGSTYMPVASISRVGFAGVRPVRIGNPGVPALRISVMRPCVMMISAGPCGGPPLPVMMVAPRITKVSYGPAANAASRGADGFICAAAAVAARATASASNVFIKTPKMPRSIDGGFPRR